MSTQVRDQVTVGGGFTVGMRVEFWDREGTKVEMAVDHDAVRFQTIPAAGDLIAPGMIFGGVDTCPVVHHLEHFPAPSWREAENSEPGYGWTIVVIRGRWPVQEAGGKELVEAYVAHGWKRAWSRPQ